MGQPNHDSKKICDSYSVIDPDKSSNGVPQVQWDRMCDGGAVHCVGKQPENESSRCCSGSRTNGSLSLERQGFNDCLLFAPGPSNLYTVTVTESSS